MINIFMIYKHFFQVSRRRCPIMNCWHRCAYNKRCAQAFMMFYISRVCHLPSLCFFHDRTCPVLNDNCNNWPLISYVYQRSVIIKNRGVLFINILSVFGLFRLRVIKIIILGKHEMLHIIMKILYWYRYIEIFH